MVILDTSIIIEHIRETEGLSLLERAKKQAKNTAFGLSMLSVQELYAGQSTRNKSDEAELLMILNGLDVLPYSYEIARLAGTITRDTRTKIPFADAAIAATALAYKAALFTLDKKDFSKIAELQLFSL